ncbi:MAG: DUF1697 domain-containing protein, partial [bacterium]
INIGKRKRVPMDALKKMCEGMGFQNVRTLLASGNVVFNASKKKVNALASELETQLENTFGFEVGVIVRTLTEVRSIVDSDPFGKIEVTKSTRLYVTFLAEKPAERISTPLRVADKGGASFRILTVADNAVCSVVELGESGTTDAMSVLVRMFGKKITTRNWNTIVKLLARES